MTTPTPAPEAPRSVRVRIAVAVDAGRSWAAIGGSHIGAYNTPGEALWDYQMTDDLDQYRRVAWIVADVPLPEEPEPVTVEGSVVE